MSNNLKQQVMVLIWFVFFLLALTTAAVLVPFKRWRKLWPFGLLGMAIIYPIDSTLVSLKAFQFNSMTWSVSGLPVPYWAGYFPGGILFGYFIPGKPQWKIYYVLSSALVLLGLEMVLVWLGFFYHLNWNPLKSYLLNIGGYAALLGLAEWLRIIPYKQGNVD